MEKEKREQEETTDQVLTVLLKGGQPFAVHIADRKALRKNTLKQQKNNNKTNKNKKILVDLSLKKEKGKEQGYTLQVTSSNPELDGGVHTDPCQDIHPLFVGQNMNKIN